VVAFVADRHRTTLVRADVGAVHLYRAGDAPAAAPGAAAPAVAFLDAGTVALGDAGLVTAVAEVKAGKRESAATNRDLVAALRALAPHATAWTATTAPGALATSLPLGSDAAVALGRAVWLGIALSAGEGAALTALVRFPARADAEAFATALGARFGELDGLLGYAAREAAPLADVSRARTLCVEGTTVVLKLDAPAELMARLRTWLAAEGSRGAGHMLATALLAAGPLGPRATVPLAAGSVPVEPLIRDPVLKSPPPTVDRVPAPPPPPPSSAAAMTPACAAYVRCVDAMASAYEGADFPGAADAGKALRDAAASMRDVFGSAPDEACTAAMDAMHSAKDAYKGMKGFVWPKECD
jgi:hypothetical protein